MCSFIEVFHGVVIYRGGGKAFGTSLGTPERTRAKNNVSAFTQRAEIFYSHSDSQETLKLARGNLHINIKASTLLLRTDYILISQRPQHVLPQFTKWSNPSTPCINAHNTNKTVNNLQINNEVRLLIKCLIPFFSGERSLNATRSMKSWGHMLKVMLMQFQCKSNQAIQFWNPELQSRPVTFLWFQFDLNVSLSLSTTAEQPFPWRQQNRRDNGRGCWWRRVRQLVRAV